MLNKRGSLQDLAYVGLILLSFGLIVLFGFVFSDNINDELQANSVVTADAKAASTTLLGFYPGIIDNSFLFLVIGIVIVMLILATLVRIHPIFIPLFIIGLIIMIFVSGIMSNIYQEASTDPNLVDYADQLVFTSTILQYLPLFIGTFGFVLMVLMYKLWSVAQT